MPREEQINAELASRVDVEKQSIALKFKGDLLDDDRVAILTDDEAIIATGRVYDRLAKLYDRVQNITLATGFGFAFLAMLAQDWGTFAIGVCIAIGIYYVLWVRRKNNVAAEIIEALWSTGEAKKKRLEVTTSSHQPSQAPIFDVPPQSGE